MSALTYIRSTLVFFNTKRLPSGIFGLLFLASFLSQAQNITELEYYFGSDPGIGNATMVTATANTGELTQSLSIPLTGLQEGFHTLTIRAKDNANTWGLFNRNVFYISEDLAGSNPVSNLAAAEYWFDGDPGPGNGTALTISGSPSETTENFVIPLGTLTVGFHTLGLRTQNLDGTWSLFDRNVFYVSEDLAGSDPVSNLAAAEYWFDADPGPGNGTALTISGSPSETTENFVIPLGTLSEGFHTLGLRTQNLDGTWSLFDRNVFFVSEELLGGNPISNLQGAEYWFDGDPGPGNGTAIAITGNPSETLENFIIPLGSLEKGFHNLGLRIQNLDGTWSLFDRKIFYIDEAQTVAEISPLTDMEFLYDAELGFGTGAAIAITPTGNPDEYLVEIPTNLVTCDLHNVSLSMKNANGDYSLYRIITDVDVFDNADPTIVVFPNITVALDANGEASITIADVDDGTFDDCELVSVVLNQTQFNYTCANLGANTVIVTATDAEAKVSTLDVTITVVDLIDPVAISQNITVQLDANGTVSFTADDIDNTSTDNCSIANKSLDVSSFTCANLGANTVTLTVTDTSGNTNSTTATVTVEDNVNPVAITENITVQLDASGNVSIVADAIDNNSTDNCTITSKALDITSFTCANLGANTVILTVTDQSGNTNATTATVTVEDVIVPTVITQNITVQLDANGNATITAAQIENGSTDNCSINNSNLNITSFTCNDLGSNTVTLSVTDQSNNTGSVTAIVTVEDNINPVAIAQNITVQLDANGNATFTADDVDNNSTDNCAIASKSLDVSSFTCNDIGTNSVILTVFDATGNQNSTNVVVTVEDNIAPVALAIASITLQLDANGEATLDAFDLDNGSTDNCGIALFEVIPSTFSCFEIGNNTAIFHASDDAGNTSTVDVTVIIEENINPVAVAQNITVQLDTNGAASITANDVDNNSTDNCAIANKSLDMSSFDCNNLGANTVTLTVEDASTNSDSTTAIITVEDNINPIAIGQDITIGLNGNASVTIIADDVNNGSNDNCGFILAIDVDTFTTLGDFPVVLTATDSSGNTHSVTVTVTVVETLGIDDNEINVNSIKLYPVPVSKQLHIDTNLTIDEIIVFELNGKRVLQIKNPKPILNVSELSEGVYFIQFRVENKTVTKRFIKQ